MKNRLYPINARFSLRTQLAPLAIAFGWVATPLVAQAQGNADCISARAGISDAWCQAVACAPVYVQGGFCRRAEADSDARDDDTEAPVNDAIDADERARPRHEHQDDVKPSSTRNPSSPRQLRKEELQALENEAYFNGANLHPQGTKPRR